MHCDNELIVNVLIVSKGLVYILQFLVRAKTALHIRWFIFTIFVTSS